MPFTSGTFSLYTPGNPTVTGTTISSTWANNTLNDIASGLSTCILKDGTQTVTANIPMNGFGFTQLASLAANGGTSISLTNGQLAFPATQNPSTNANTLDDYEEGTWTPVLAGEITPGTQTYTVQAGRYVKIGKMVMLQGYLSLSAVGATCSGNLTVTGIPFASVTAGGMLTAGAMQWDRVLMSSTDYAYLTLYISSNSSVATIVQCGSSGSNTSLSLPVSGITAQTAMGFTLSYIAAA